MNAQLKLINDAFDALRWAFDHHSPNWAETLLDKCRDEEKQHRGFMDGFARCHTHDTISIGQAGKLFAVKRVAEYLVKPEYPRGKDYLHTQKSCFIAAGMADEFGAEIRKAWAAFDLVALVALDYTQFVKIRQPEQAVA